MNQDNLSEQTTQEKQSPEKKIPLTIEELVSSGHPYIKVGDQYVATEKWPDKKHKRCFGTGNLGILLKYSDAFKLGANDRCFCGSGNKFKRCCRSKVERMRRSGFILTCPCVGESHKMENPELDKVREELNKTLGHLR